MQGITYAWQMIWYSVGGLIKSRISSQSSLPDTSPCVKLSIPDPSSVPAAKLYRSAEEHVVPAAIAPFSSTYWNWIKIDPVVYKLYHLKSSSKEFTAKLLMLICCWACCSRPEIRKNTDAFRSSDRFDRSIRSQACRYCRSPMISVLCSVSPLSPGPKA